MNRQQLCSGVTWSAQVEAEGPGRQVGKEGSEDLPRPGHELSSLRVPVVAKPDFTISAGPLSGHSSSKPLRIVNPRQMPGAASSPGAGPKGLPIRPPWPSRDGTDCFHHFYFLNIKDILL